MTEVDAGPLGINIDADDAAAAPVELVTLFTLDGKDYQIPAKPGPGLLLRYLRQAADPRIGQDGATMNLLLGLLGPVALDALAESPKVTEDHMAAIFSAVSTVAFDGIKRMRASAGN